MIYKISIYNQSLKLISEDFHEFPDMDQAITRAQADCDWLGGTHFETTCIR